jgi:putative phosphoesterase
VKNPALLVMSDTHGNIASLKAVLAWAKKHQIDDAAFLGDGADDISAAVRETAFSGSIAMARGNGDSHHHIPTAMTLDFAGHTFFLVHGHLHRVNDGFDSLIAAAISVDADAALYGHTHVPFWEEMSGMLVLNPGSVGAPRSRIGPSFAVIECPPNEWFVIRYWKIKDGVIGKTIEEIDLQPASIGVRDLY